MSVSDVAKRPLVSVVIPVWNGQSHLASAIASVSALSQTGGNFELVVIDDGSTDATPEVISTLQVQYPRMRSVRCPTNQGVANARNLGIAAARGEFVMFLDADDRLVEGAWAPISKAIEENPAAEILYFRSRFHMSGRYWEVTPFRHMNAVSILAANTINNSGTLVRRALAMKLGVRSIYHEDYDFWLRSWKHGARFVYVDEVVSVVNKIAGSLSSSLAKSAFGSIVVRVRNAPLLTLLLAPYIIAAYLWIGLARRGLR